MKVSTSNFAKVEFKELNSGMAFYNECDELFMKITKGAGSENAVCLRTGILWTFMGNVRVKIANVRIVDD